MQTITTAAALTAAIQEAKQAHKTIGLVPTMGALHDGHLSLVNRARKENDLVVVSVFVNPIQFNNKEDLAKYPRTVEADCEKLAAAGADIAFVPTVPRARHHCLPFRSSRRGDGRPPSSRTLLWRGCRGAPPLRPRPARPRLLRREGLPADCHHPQPLGANQVPHRTGPLPHCPSRRRPCPQQPQYAPLSRSPRHRPHHLRHPPAGCRDVGLRGCRDRPAMGHGHPQFLP